MVLSYALRYSTEYSGDVERDPNVSKMAFLDPPLQRRMRRNMMGGYAGVNVRYAKVNETLIRGVKIVRAIVGYDA